MATESSSHPRTEYENSWITMPTTDQLAYATPTGIARNAIAR